jgi:hypothetical protein
MRLMLFIFLTMLLTGCSTFSGKERAESLGNSQGDPWNYETWLSHIGEPLLRDFEDPYQFHLRLLVYKPPHSLATVLVGAGFGGFISRTRVYGMNGDGMLLYDQSRLLTTDELDQVGYIDALLEALSAQPKPQPPETMQSVYSIFLDEAGTRYVLEIWGASQNEKPDVLIMTDPVNLSYTSEETTVLSDSFQTFESLSCEGMELHGLREHLKAYRTLIDSIARVTELDNIRMNDKRLP